MKYYFKYIVKAVDRHGKKCTIELRADNPAHLLRRFREKYPSRKIISFSAEEEKGRS